MMPAGLLPVLRMPHLDLVNNKLQLKWTFPIFPWPHKSSDVTKSLNIWSWSVGSYRLYRPTFLVDTDGWLVVSRIAALVAREFLCCAALGRRFAKVISQYLWHNPVKHVSYKSRRTLHWRVHAGMAAKNHKSGFTDFIIFPLTTYLLSLCCFAISVCQESASFVALGAVAMQSISHLDQRLWEYPTCCGIMIVSSHPFNTGQAWDRCWSSACSCAAVAVFPTAT